MEGMLQALLVCKDEQLTAPTHPSHLRSSSCRTAACIHASVSACTRPKNLVVQKRTPSGPTLHSTQHTQRGAPTGHGHAQVGQEAPVILLDTDGSAAGAAARDLAAAAPERPVLFTVGGGAAAWLAQELPWKEPLKLRINLDTIKAIDISGVAEGARAVLPAAIAPPRVCARS